MMSKDLPDMTDLYMPDPGTVAEPLNCGVCGTEMLVERGCYGPTQWAMAMSGRKRHYDRFTCPHREEAWHEQVVRLRREQKDTASRSIADILEREIAEILATKTPTK